MRGVRLKTQPRLRAVTFWTNSARQCWSILAQNSDRRHKLCSGKAGSKRQLPPWLWLASLTSPCAGAASQAQTPPNIHGVCTIHTYTHIHIYNTQIYKHNTQRPFLLDLGFFVETVYGMKIENRDVTKKHMSTWNKIPDYLEVSYF